jgi:uncharacterized protein (TIGR03435 family)
MRAPAVTDLIRIAVTAYVVVSVPLASQVSARSEPSFDVASIKRNADGTGRAIRSIPPEGNVLFLRHSLTALILYAYDLPTRMQLVGAPEWASRDLFDIRAIPPIGASAEQVPAMLRTLLADRFRLRARSERRQLPLYALVVDRGGLGPSIERSSFDCTVYLAKGGTVGGTDNPRDRNGKPLCGTQTGFDAGMTIRSGGIPLSEVARLIEYFGGVDRPVVDETGLTGRFNVRLVYAPPQTSQLASQFDAPLIYQAVQEQWGLKLVAREAPTDVLVIESVQRPAAD